MSPLASVRGFPTPQGAIDLDVHAGDVVLVRGPNGAGKTSLLRALAGLDAPLRPEHVRAAPASLAPQDARDGLVGLTVAGEMRLRGLPLLEDLRALRDRDSASLSSGEARRVALAAADGRALLLLDEPVEGLDGAGRARLREAVAAGRRRGAVVAVDHAGELDALATRVVELAPGAQPPLPEIQRTEGPIVLHASAARLRGRALPPVRLGPGFHALVGPNGAGKSTLLLRLAGLLDARGVMVAGGAPRPGVNVRLLLPRARDHLTRDRVAEECAEHPLVPRGLRERHPLALSGGEAQRVALAKTLGTPAPLYLLDEPEAHLDAEGRARLLDAIAARVAEGACVLAATHDEALVARAQSVVEKGAPP